MKELKRSLTKIIYCTNVRLPVSSLQQVKDKHFIFYLLKAADWYPKACTIKTAFQLLQLCLTLALCHHFFLIFISSLFSIVFLNALCNQYILTKKICDSYWIPNSFYFLSLKPSLVSHTRTVTHDTPVSVIPEEQWCDYQEPNMPDCDVSYNQ